MHDEQPTGLARFHALIFSLLFPGFLAAFLLTQFTEEANLQGFAPWSWILCVYFAVQFVEGHETKARYSLGRAIVNVLELSIMTLIFAALGYFPDLETSHALRTPAMVSFLIGLVFALPALYRLIAHRGSLSRANPNRKFAWSLTAMSVAAALLSGFFAEERWAQIAVFILLMVYMICFQFANSWLLDRLDPAGKGWISGFRRQ